MNIYHLKTPAHKNYSDMEEKFSPPNAKTSFVFLRVSPRGFEILIVLSDTQNRKKITLERKPSFSVSEISLAHAKQRL